jgi:predicted RNA-binding Zn ribbon-like protein
MDDQPWLKLLNSDWHDYRGSGLRRDLLDDPAWFERFVKPWRPVLGAVPDGDIRTALKGLRRLVRAVVDHVAAGRHVPGRLWSELNAVLADSPFVRRLERSGPGYAFPLVPRTPGLGAMLGEIASGFGETLARGEPARIKVCDNHDCLWVFYDRSKNRSRRWCEGNTGCGNLMKVRRFRAKHKPRLPVPAERGVCLARKAGKDKRG